MTVQLKPYVRRGEQGPPMANLRARATQNKNSSRSYGEVLPEVLPKITLHHGRALWVLTQLGFRGAASESTFFEYIKSLRKLGTPFEHGEIGFGRRGLANYTYCHLMELALALTLRVYHVVPDSVLAEIIGHRKSLYRHYKRAYIQRSSGIGVPIIVETKGRTPIVMSGAFLDLQMNFSGGRLVSFGPPRLLSPFDTMKMFNERDLAARAFLPINLSLLSERVVALALNAPMIGRGLRRH
jgi:hypothetical protein